MLDFRGGYFLARDAISSLERASVRAPRDGSDGVDFAFGDCVCTGNVEGVAIRSPENGIRELFVLRFGQNEIALPIRIEQLKSEGGGEIQFSCLAHGHSNFFTYVSARRGRHVKVGLSTVERIAMLSRVVGSFDGFGRLSPS